MTFQTLFLAAVLLAFGTLFSVLMYAWLATGLPTKPKPAPVEATPARRPEPAPLKLAA